MIKKGICASVILLAFACTSQQVVDTGTKVGTVILSEKATLGKTVYDNNCGKCHELYDKSKYIAEKGNAKWAAVCEQMIPKIQDKDKTNLANLRAYLYN